MFFKDAGSNNILLRICLISLISLFFNAKVERSFSQMNLVKSKLRNRMQCMILPFFELATLFWATVPLSGAVFI